MKCRQCGFENAISAQYCAKCGIMIKSTVEEISEASRAELKKKRRERIEKVLHTSFIIFCILLIPLLFFYFYLDDPKKINAFVTGPYATAEFEDVFTLEAVKFNEKPFLLELPDTSFTTAGYISARLSDSTRGRLISFFNPDNKDQYKDILAALKRLAEFRNAEGTWHNEGGDLRMTAHVLLALTAHGYSTGHSEMGALIKKGLDACLVKDTREIAADTTEEYSLLLLAFIENSLLDPDCAYTARVFDMISALRKKGSRSGEWQKFFRKRSSNIIDLYGTLCASRVLAEAEQAGLCRLSVEERGIIISNLKSQLKITSKKDTEKDIFLRQNWMLYIIMLLNNGEVPDYGKPVLDRHVGKVMELDKTLPPSLLGMHYMLLALHRSSDRRTADVRAKVMGLYNGSFNKDQCTWPEASETHISGSGEAAAAAVIVRTYALPYLFPLCK